MLHLSTTKEKVNKTLNQKHSMVRRNLLLQSSLEIRQLQTLVCSVHSVLGFFIKSLSPVNYEPDENVIIYAIQNSCLFISTT